MKPDNKNTQKSIKFSWVYTLAFLVILIIGAYLRLGGVNWDEDQHLHPDERFLTMVESAIQPVENLGDYFDTNTSSLNPNNRGHDWFVYGTLPIFIVRYVGEWLGQTGYGEIHLVGRVASALVDLMVVLLVYLIARRLYGQKVGLLASAFSTFTVLQIQQSHFFTVDTFTNFFTYLAIYFAITIATLPPRSWNLKAAIINTELDEGNQSGDNYYLGLLKNLVKHPVFLPSLVFGIALGMAVASKINAVPVAVVLPVAIGTYWYSLTALQRKRQVVHLFVYMVLAAGISIITFRILQPYAFAGPGILNFGLSEKWIATLKSLQAQTSGDVDFPPALQWARRPVWFSLKNMVLWGLGLPLGIAAWSGFIWMGYKIISGVWKRHAVLWIWALLYFSWQSLIWNSTMRYQLPVYPALAIFAAWGIFQLYEAVVDRSRNFPAGNNLLRLIVGTLSAFILIYTAVWAFSFSRIYTRQHTRVEATRWLFQNVRGPITLPITSDDGVYYQPLPFPQDEMISQDRPYLTSFTAFENGEISSILLGNVVFHDQAGDSGIIDLTVILTSQIDGAQTAIGSLERSNPTDREANQQDIEVFLTKPVEMIEANVYNLEINLQGEGVLSLSGDAIANESSWDDGLPLRIDGYDPFGGIYQGDLTFEMYWDDNQEKLQRFTNNLDIADYVVISSSRQWGTTTRLPERYPLTSMYYRQLLGCPDGITIEDCYDHAEVGTYQGYLGFDLIKTFDSNPSLSVFEINDQPAEEAFTVYDHPKVFIFKKTENYDSNDVREILSLVDLSGVIHITPKQADSQPKDLMLPYDRLEEQRVGGTWSSFFDPDSLQNRFQVIGVILWYISIGLIGLSVYPLVRLAFPGLSDHGYPLARTIGLLLLSWIVWVSSSMRLPFERPLIGIALLLMASVGGFFAYRQRSELVEEFRSKPNYFVWIELLALGLFLIGLLIRYGNPDLWHPWKGGEKPMDFSYFNAILKSTSFPPYDPWFSGGYINYYYYGFVFVGVLVKFLGLVPSFAYNLILPTMFMFIALGGFSVVWNLAGRQPKNNPQPFPEKDKIFGLSKVKLGTGLAGGLGLALLGNLGILQMVVKGSQLLVVSQAELDNAGIFQRAGWMIDGIIKIFSGANIPFRGDQWYWNPSRVIPAPGDVEPITEFPFFTFLYGDLHAHLMALTIALVVLAWVVSIILSRGWSRKLGAENQKPTRSSVVLGMLLGGLAIGSLYPINLSDIYTYLPIGMVALFYAIWSRRREKKTSNPVKNSAQMRYILISIAGLVMLSAIAYYLYQPYSQWYAQGYSEVKIWRGTRTGTMSYLTHWGLFLFLIVTWMVNESIDWMASTPVSALNKLKPYKGLITFIMVVLSLIIVAFGVGFGPQDASQNQLPIGLGVNIIWYVLPLAVLAGVLLLRPGISDSKRIVLFFVGTGLLLTLMVEIVVVSGDIGRMNTVFKFYLQAWTLFAVSAAASLGWIWNYLPKWSALRKISWQLILLFLASVAAMYPIMGSIAKIKDRMDVNAPQTLDGMEYMKYATYDDLGVTMDLGQDYRAIRWLQENVEGSPVIVEANQVEYHWGSRYSVYTGLPGVVGWNWHQRQQRTSISHQLVYDRVEGVHEFYETTSLNSAIKFLDLYDVSYIIVGQLERARYPGPGLDKFSKHDGMYWDQVYTDMETIIYKVKQ